nr:radical SAM protein [Lachnospiraceae bacterium]
MIKGERLEVRHERTPLDTVCPLPAPFVLFIDPCGACNFTCNFCPCNVSDYKITERHAVMELKTFKKVIDDVASFPEQVKVIYLFGFGEPLLHKDFFEMASYVKEKNACRELRVVTNGSLLSPEVNKKIVDSGIDLVRISVEALDAKGYKDVCDFDLDYDAFLANIKDLHERAK